jgi:hypothetical protein
LCSVVTTNAGAMRTDAVSACLRTGATVGADAVAELAELAELDDAGRAAPGATRGAVAAAVSECERDPQASATAPARRSGMSRRVFMGRPIQASTGSGAVLRSHIQSKAKLST